MSGRKILSVLLALCMAVGLMPSVSAAEDVHTVVLSSVEASDGTWSHSAVVDGEDVAEYDYVWNVDPGTAHDEVKDAPAEYYTGTEPGDDDVYIAHDIYYWPELPVDGFQLVNYDGAQEWAYYYTAEGYENYIFGTLPAEGTGVPTDMMHSSAEAYENAVLHITKAGTYSLSGDWHGQIWIDLGDTSETFADPDAKVTIILNGVDVTCTVAPAIVFYSVYECDNTWETRTSYSAAVDTSDAGARVVIADGTVNNFSGSNIYRMLKATYKSGQEGAAVPVQKKVRKTDGAFYSYVSMNIECGAAGTGVLNITSGYEGLDTELHLTINGGNVNIFADNDGINVNEDGVSVVTINGGNVHILAGLGSEGDGVDSNGYLVINGGTVISIANPNSDSGLDSDNGSYINGGTVVALGSTMDWAEADDTDASGQAIMNIQFAAAQSSDEAIIVTGTDGGVVFAYDPDKDEVAEARTRSYLGAIVSFPELTVGQSYYLYVGGDVYGSETEGIYDVSTVTGFSDDAKQQCYAGTWENRGDNGEFNPDGGEFSPDNGEFDPGSGEFNPDGGEFNPGNGEFNPDNSGDVPDMGGRPDGTGDANDGGQDGNMINPDGAAEDIGRFPGGTVDMETTVIFTMAAKVNNFSFVTDYDGGEADGGTDGSGGADTDTDTGTGSSGAGGVSGGGVSGGGVSGGGSGNGGSGESDGTADDSGLADMPFGDVSSGDYFYGSVCWAVARGITTGTSATTFSPGESCTRAQAVTFIWRAEGSPNPGSADSAFTDVDYGSYYADAVRWAAENGIMNGTGDNLFDVDGVCTRGQIVTILYRLAGSPAVAEGSIFSDVADDAYYTSAVIWATQLGITNGTGEGRFSPDAACTRAQIVTFLYRFLSD